MKTDQDLLHAYIRSSYTYPEIADPVTAVTLTPLDEDRARDFEGAQDGDWFIEDGVLGEVVRIQNGQVLRIWSNG